MRLTKCIYKSMEVHPFVMLLQKLQQFFKALNALRFTCRPCLKPLRNCRTKRNPEQRKSAANQHRQQYRPNTWILT